MKFIKIGLDSNYIKFNKILMISEAICLFATEYDKERDLRSVPLLYHIILFLPLV